MTTWSSWQVAGSSALRLESGFAHCSSSAPRVSLRSPSRFRRAASFGAVLGIVGVGVHSLFDFGLHMMVNALIFMTLVVIATTELKDETYSNGDLIVLKGIMSEDRLGNRCTC